MIIQNEHIKQWPH